VQPAVMGGQVWLLPGRCEGGARSGE
jgi:hypothetical protein